MHAVVTGTASGIGLAPGVVLASRGTPPARGQVDIGSRHTIRAAAAVGASAAAKVPAVAAAKSLPDCLYG
jgi:hypothetical protein